jgi:serine/threonine-protein kinase
VPDSARWARINELFHAAVAKPVAERAAFLSEQCGSEAALRAEVESLLAAHREGETGVRLGAIAVGSRLGDYEVTGFIAAGGMGEVYRARDTKLGRDVAIKILPRLFTSDPERLARFEREARMLATLNHPQIGGIYGVEEADGVLALVLELVEGPTLADRLQRGPLSVTEALTIARQIADALDAAHEKGIIHRDLKPANIKVTPDGIVKVLDFGLAKATTGDGTTADLTQSPTVTVAGTREGIILGTAAYMSPEQARGQRVDKRTDIWAFGCVLFEMITGKPAFAGRDDLRRRRGHIGALSRIGRRCRRRRPSRSAASAMGAGERSSTAAARHRGCAPRVGNGGSRFAWRGNTPLASSPMDHSRGVGRGRDCQRRASALLSRVLCVPCGIGWHAPQFEVRHPRRPDGSAPRNVAISPDGRFVAYLAGPPGHQKTYLRRIGELESQVIAELPMQAPQPFFSPDSQWLAFFDAGKLKKLAVDGGSPITLAEAPTPRGGTWGTDGSIVFAPISRGGLMWIPPSGGPPRVLTTPNGDRGETSHRFPAFLPQSSMVLFVADGTSDSNSLQAASLGDPRSRLIMRGAVTNPRYLPTGHLGYLINEKLVAAPFDRQTLQLTGPPNHAGRACQLVCVLRRGHAGLQRVNAGQHTCVHPGVDRARWRSHAVALASGELQSPAHLSRRPQHRRAEGTCRRRKLVGVRHDARHLTKFTLTDATNWPVWTPDGKRVIYGSNRPDTQWDIVEKPADGSGPERTLLARPLTQIPAGGIADRRHARVRGNVCGPGEHVMADVAAWVRRTAPVVRPCRRDDADVLVRRTLDRLRVTAIRTQRGVRPVQHRRGAHVADFQRRRRRACVVGERP